MLYISTLNSSQSSGATSVLTWIIWMKSSTDPDQLASSEVSWSGTAMFKKKVHNFEKRYAHSAILLLIWIHYMDEKQCESWSDDEASWSRSTMFLKRGFKFWKCYDRSMLYRSIIRSQLIWIHSVFKRGNKILKMLSMLISSKTAGR